MTSSGTSGGGKLQVRCGKGKRGSGPRERMVPLINGAGRTLRWFIEDVWGQFGDDHTRPGAPLLPSERKSADGSSRRVGGDALRDGLAEATKLHLPSWTDKLTPHVLRHFCASQLCLNGLDLISRSRRFWGIPGLARRCGTSICSRPGSKMLGRQGKSGPRSGWKG
ncbi:MULTISPECIES: hypothetical protein [unclassified Streptomyces]|uniref:hypothetical protein n=1 Tax=Streptomyces sp. NPDC127532 TaxID=3345399 RepID=UPI003640E04D